MSVQAMSWAMTQQLVTDPAARHVLLCLANYADSKGRSAYPAQETLARDTGMSDRTVRRKLAELLEAGLITRGNRAAAYADPDIERKSWAPVAYDLRLDLIDSCPDTVSGHEGSNARTRMAGHGAKMGGQMPGQKASMPGQNPPHDRTRVADNPKEQHQKHPKESPVGEGEQRPPDPGSVIGLIPEDWQPNSEMLDQRLRMSGVKFTPGAETVAGFIAHYRGNEIHHPLRRWDWLFVGWCLKQARFDESGKARATKPQAALEQRATLAWSEVRLAIGGKPIAKWSDPLTAEVVAGMGTMTALRDTRTDRMSFVQREFEKLFVAKAQASAAA